MTVPKSRETSAVYICSNTGNAGSIFICSKTEDEGSILYAARQGMRACNNNRCREGLRMLLLLHGLIPCLAAYNILPSSSVLLHINILPAFPVLLHIPSFIQF